MNQIEIIFWSNAILMTGVICMFFKYKYSK